MLTVVLGLLVLSALVVVHELGHFWVARGLGVGVERFSIGFGPVLLSRRRNGVEYALSAFPLGGYVKMKGDDPRHREDLRPNDLFAAAWWRRVLIALAGPGANFFFAILVSIVLLWVGFRVPDGPNEIGSVGGGSTAHSVGFRSQDRIAAVNGVAVTSLKGVYDQLPASEEATGDPISFTLEQGGARREIEVAPEDLQTALGELEFPIPAEVGEVVVGTPAYRAGLVVGDRVTAVDGKPVQSFSDLQVHIRDNPGAELILTVVREGRTIQLPITPFSDTSGDEPVGKIGIRAASPDTYVVRLGFWEGIVQGPRSTVAMVGSMFQAIGSLFANPSNFSQISGPVAIIQASGGAAQAGIDRLLETAILFSVALMVFNLLPIPILDGGMIVLTLLEAVRRRPIGEKGLALYQGIGIAVMGTLLIFVLINDPLRILQRHNALGRAGDLTP